MMNLTTEQIKRDLGLLNEALTLVTNLRKGISKDVSNSLMVGRLDAKKNRCTQYKQIWENLLVNETALYLLDVPNGTADFITNYLERSLKTYPIKQLISVPENRRLFSDPTIIETCKQQIEILYTKLVKNNP